MGIKYICRNCGYITRSEGYVATSRRPGLELLCPRCRLCSWEKVKEEEKKNG